MTRKITKYIGGLIKNFVKNISSSIHGVEFNDYPKLKLGNIKASRDWGYAKDYVEGMWLMLQQPSPDDYVLATGETHTVEEFLEEAFSMYNLDWKNFVELDKKFERPSEVPYLRGDALKAKEKLGWTPKTKFKELVKNMVQYDVEHTA